MSSALRLASCFLPVLLAGCSGGGPELAEPQQRTVQGAFTKGPVVGASIEVFNFDPAGQISGAAVASASTDAQGRFILAGVPQGGPFLVRSRGGEFLDESDKFAQRKVSLAADEGLESILPVGATEVAINSYTQALVSKTRAEAQGNSFLSLIDSNRGHFRRALGFDVLRTLPANPIRPAGSGASINYAMVLGGAANSIAHIAAATGGNAVDFAAIQAFSRDLSDGRLDGAERGTAVVVNGQAIPDGDLNREIARFRNNNDAAYAGRAAVVVDEAVLGQAPVADLEANRAPYASGDAYTGDEAGTLTVAAPGVLENDGDYDGQTPTAVLVTAPMHAASFDLRADGSFEYLHDGSETTADSFSYRASDGRSESATVVVSLSINPLNDAPTAIADSYTAIEGTTLTISAPGVLSNDTDAEGDALSAVLETAPLNASSFSLNADGSFAYTHDGSESTSDSFSYRASDGSLESEPVTVSLTISPVNDAPTAAADSYATSEGGSLSIAAPGVLANDTDPEGDTLSAVLEAPPARAAAFALHADGRFSYVHDGSETTADSFSYRASDGGLESAAVTVSLTISPVNDAPVAVADSYTLGEGGSLNVPAAGVLSNDTDAEGDALSAVLQTGPAQAASFTLNPDGSFSYTHDGSESTGDSFSYRASDGNLSSAAVTVSLTISPVNDAPVASADSYSVAEAATLNVAAPGVLANDLDADGDGLSAVLETGPGQAASFTLNADGSFAYTHDGSESTGDSFSYRASDGSLQSDPVVVSITITPVNDAPSAADDSFAAAEGASLNVAAPGVLGNDTDVEGDALSAVLETGPTLAASFTLNADGSFSYTHDGSETSSDSFTYRASDGVLQSAPATVSLSISPVDDAPVIDVNNGLSVVAGASAALTTSILSASDPDSDDASISFTRTSTPACGSFQLSGADVASFSQQNLNDGLVAYSAVDCAGGESLDIGMQAANGGPATAFQFAITITPAPNQPPVAVDDAYALDEAATLNVATPGVIGNDSDPDGDNLAAELIVEPVNAASFTLNPDGSFSYRHDGSETTSDSFSYRVSDGVVNSADAVVNLTINAVNDPPALDVNQGVSVFGGGSTPLDTGELSASDPDHGAAALSFSVVVPPSCGTFTLSGSPVASFTQAQLEAAQVGFDASSCAPDQVLDISMNLADGAGGNLAFNFRVTVLGPTNLPPVNQLPDGPLSVALNQPTSIEGLKVDDPDADESADLMSYALTVSNGVLTLRTDVSGGVTAAQLSGNGSAALSVSATLDQLGKTLKEVDGLTYSADPGFVGADTLNIDLNDNGATGAGGAQSDNDNLVLYVNRIEPAGFSGSDGVRLEGDAGDQRVGSALAQLGDFNGDGLADVLVTSRTEEAYVVYGQGGSLPASVAVSSVEIADGQFAQGVLLQAQDDSEGFGQTATSGDLNGDGLMDVAIGEPRAQTNGDYAGSVYVVFGAPLAPATVRELENLNGNNGLRIIGPKQGTRAGAALAFAGDVNGDGLDDLLVGMPYFDLPSGPSNAGAVALIFGASSGFPAVLDIADLDGNNGVLLTGIAKDDLSGWSIAGADLTGDGMSDVIIGAPQADAQGQSNSGRVSVVYGSALNQGAASFSLSAIDGTNGFVFEGLSASATVGWSVAGTSDMNADGLAEMIIGAKGTDPNGAAYVVFGSVAAPPSLLPSDLTGLNGFALTSSDEDAALLGWTVASAGDFNADGIGDILVGDLKHKAKGRSFAGQNYIVFGRLAAYPATLDLGAVDGTVALQVPGRRSDSEQGAALAGGGDFNGDGFGDVLSGAPKVDQPLGARAGEVYLLFGF